MSQNTIKPRRVALAVPNFAHFVPCVRVTNDFLSLRGFVFETDTPAAPGARDLAQALVSIPVRDVPEFGHPAWQVRFRGEHLDLRLAGHVLRYVGGARLDFTCRGCDEPGQRVVKNLWLLNLDKFNEVTGSFQYVYPTSLTGRHGRDYLQMR